MSLVSLLIVLVVVGFALWLVNTLIPMNPKIRKVVTAVVLFAVCLWLLQAFGILSGGPVLRVR